MALKRITENAAYITGAVNVGVIETEGGGAILIDSGLEKRVARRLLDTLKKEGLFPLAVINTHGHPDHCGGSAYLKQEAGVEILASRPEAVLMENPWLEPRYLTCGAEPFPGLENKFLQGEPVEVDHLLEMSELSPLSGPEGSHASGREESSLNISGLNPVSPLTAVDLSGHTPGMIGIACEGVLFCADSFFAAGTLSRHPVPHLMDVGGFLQTLEELEASDYSHYLPSHGRLNSDISALLEQNRERVQEILNFMRERLQQSQAGTEEIIGEVFEHYQVDIDDVQSYCLNRTALLAHLSHLLRRDEIEVTAARSGLRWSGS